MATTTRRKAAAPVAEPEVVEDEFSDMEDDLDLEEVEEETVVVESAPAKKTTAKAKSTKAKAPVRPPIEFGSAWLASHINEILPGESYDARGIRMLLRKLAKDAVFAREIGLDRSRYEFTGPDDKIVKAVVTMIKSGAAKALKQEGLDAVKEKAAAKRAQAKADKERAEAEAEELGDDVDEIEVEEDEEPEEAPKPTRTRRTAAKTTATAPAKATQSTRRRAAAK